MFCAVYAVVFPWISAPSQINPAYTDRSCFVNLILILSSHKPLGPRKISAVRQSVTTQKTRILGDTAASTSYWHWYILQLHMLQLKQRSLSFRLSAVQKIVSSELFCLCLKFC